MMLLSGLLENVNNLSPFAANDGLLVTDSKHIIRYASGIATEQYRKLGYLDNLVGRSLPSLDTGDEQMCTGVLQDLQSREAEFDEHQPDSSTNDHDPQANQNSPAQTCTPQEDDSRYECEWDTKIDGAALHNNDRHCQYAYETQ